MALDLIPQVLTETFSAITAGQPRQDRPDEAVVLVRREVELFVIDADWIPSVQQVAQLALEIREAVLISFRVRRAAILYRRPAPGLMGGLSLGAA